MLMGRAGKWSWAAQIRREGPIIALGVLLLGYGLLKSGTHLAASVHPDDPAISQWFASPITGIWWSVAALLTWMLAEVLTTRRRLAAPSIVLAVLFAVLIGHATFVWVGATRFGAYAPPLAASGVVTALLGHYYRFRLPFTVLPLAISGWLFVMGAAILTGEFFAGSSWAGADVIAPAVTFTYGLAMFALALRLDLSDPERTTRRSDLGFWLHALAAPLMLHPLAWPIISHALLPHAAAAGPHLTPVIIGAFCVLAVVLAGICIVIDRCALLIVGLGYAGAGLLAATSHHAGGHTAPILAALAAFEVSVIGLGYFWGTLRARLVPLLPEFPGKRRLPPVRA